MLTSCNGATSIAQLFATSVRSHEVLAERHASQPEDAVDRKPESHAIDDEHVAVRVELSAGGATLKRITAVLGRQVMSNVTAVTTPAVTTAGLRRCSRGTVGCEPRDADDCVHPGTRVRSKVLPCTVTAPAG